MLEISRLLLQPSYPYLFKYQPFSMFLPITGVFAVFAEEMFI